MKCLRLVGGPTLFLIGNEQNDWMKASGNLFCRGIELDCARS
jgi:hypothetical protein